MNIPNFDDDFIKASELLLSITKCGNESFACVIKKMKEFWPDPN